MVHNEYYTTVTSHIDYEELRIEVCINNKMAVVITQEKGIDKAGIEFWYPRNHNKWILEYQLFLEILEESLNELALKVVDPVADPKEKGLFKTDVVIEEGFLKPIVKLYFDDKYLGLISQEEGLENAQLEIIACPYNKYWEFSYRGFTDCLKEAYSQLL